MGSASMRAGLPPWLVLNACVSLVVAHGFVSAAGVHPSWQAMLYAHVAFAAAIFVVAVVLGGILAFLTILPGGAWVVLGLGPLLASIPFPFLLIDRAVFRMYRFHVSGLALSAASMPGGLAELGVWPTSLRWLGFTLAGTIAVEALALGWLAARRATFPRPTRLVPGWRGVIRGAPPPLGIQRAGLLPAGPAGGGHGGAMARLVPL